MGLRPVHYAALDGDLPDDLAYFEVIAENFLTGSAPALHNLRRARERRPVVLHGVSLNLLGPEPPDRDHVRALARLARELDCPFVTDHLCFTAAHGWSSHDLLPVPPTRALAKVAAARAREVQDALERPFGLENLSPMIGLEGDTVDHEFWRDVAHDAGCGVVLDVNNLAVAQANTGSDALAALAGLDAADVLQVHVAGHRVLPDGLRVDTHDEAVSDEVVALYRAAWAALGPFPTLLEWDDLTPTLAACVAEVRRVTAGRVVAARAGIRRRAPEPTPAAPFPPDSGAFQRGLRAAVSAPLRWSPPRAAPTSPGRLGAYQEQYWMRLLSALQRRFPTVTALLGAWETNRLGSALLTAHPPGGRDLNGLGDGLPAFVVGSEWDGPVLREAAALDLAVAQVFAHPAVTPWRPEPSERDDVARRHLVCAPTLRRLSLRWALPPLRDRALSSPDEAPAPAPADDPATWLVFRTPTLAVITLRADPALARLLAALDAAPLGEALAAVGDDADAGQVQSWFQAGVRFGWWC